MRQLLPDVKHPSADIQVLQKELLQEAKNSLKRMTNRSLANVLFNLTLLRIADKALLAAAAQEVSARSDSTAQHDGIFMRFSPFRMAVSVHRPRML